MSQIPLNTQFIGLAATVDTTERRSATINAESAAYTMQDIIDTVGGGLEGTQYVFVAADGTDVQNAAELQAAYVTAQGMSPSATNRITVIAAPGSYNFSTVNFKMSADYIDLVSLDGNKSIVFNGSNTIEIAANDVFVRGVDVGTLNFTVANSLNLLRVENCSGGGGSFGGNGTADGTFTDCTGGNDSFGGSDTANGTFTNCTGGDYSFGGSGGTASGTFTDCTGGDYSFGGDGGTADGTFTDCTGGFRAFGGRFVASGTFTDCSGGEESFGGNGGDASGVFNNCTGGGGVFGSGGTASGTFTDCTGGDYSFGGGGTASGTFTDCAGEYAAFGGDSGTASGVFNSCIGGGDSFGDNGTLSGLLYYCRLTSGTFETVSGSGRTVLCIDGNNDQNNQ